jgi:hypothetical protein
MLWGAKNTVSVYTLTPPFLSIQFTLPEEADIDRNKVFARIL